MKVQKEHKTELTIEAQDLEVIAGLMMSQCVWVHLHYQPQPYLGNNTLRVHVGNYLMNSLQDNCCIMLLWRFEIASSALNF